METWTKTCGPIGLISTHTHLANHGPRSFLFLRCFGASGEVLVTYTALLIQFNTFETDVARFEGFVDLLYSIAPRIPPVGRNGNPHHPRTTRERAPSRRGPGKGGGSSSWAKRKARCGKSGWLQVKGPSKTEGGCWVCLSTSWCWASTRFQGRVLKLIRQTVVLLHRPDLCKKPGFPEMSTEIQIGVGCNFHSSQAV